MSDGAVLYWYLILGSTVERNSVCRKMKKNEKKRKINKAKEAEDWCFVCKDGGQLIICDHGDCVKVYHPDCVGKDESFEKAGGSWKCDWHSCSLCHKTPKYHCFCCPNAVCEACIKTAEFACVRGKNGLCDECLELILLGQEDVVYDSDGGKIDFKDRETYEGLFKEYWEIIKEKEGLTLDDIHAANTRLKKKKKKNHHRGSVSVKFGKIEEEDVMILSESDKEDIREYKVLHKRKRSKKQEFMGWASKPLIEFLKSINKIKDTAEQLSHNEVYSTINAYIREKNLIHPEKKRRILCDEKLYSVFRKKSLSQTKVYKLLDSHFIENLEQSEEDEDEDRRSLQHKDKDNVESYKNMIQRKDEDVDKDKDIVEAYKNKIQRALSLDRIPQEKQVDDNIAQQSCFASIVAHNIKLIYLRKSLVEELLKQIEIFQGKVVGSFVRVKNDTKDHLQRGSHQLLPVTAIQKTSTGEVLVQVSLVTGDLHLCMLSDDDFTEEECMDLQEKIKSGILKKPTVVELEKKATSLYKHIVKHWIQRELVVLQSRIDYANEKGRRRELFEYMERRELLKKPAEQERLLKQVPKVIAETIALKPASAGSDTDQ
nr:uncharacterized protein At5g08430-like isoform X1 [Ziziphus jujuba var. spinosa]